MHNTKNDDSQDNKVTECSYIKNVHKSNFGTRYITNTRTKSCVPKKSSLDLSDELDASNEMVLRQIRTGAILLLR